MKEEGIDLLIEKFNHDKSFFKDILRTQKDWIWEVNKEGIYTYCSEHVKDILGYTSREILGKTPFDLMPPEEATRVSGIITEIVENQEPIIDLENWTVHKNGELVCLLTNGVPFYDKDGNWLGYRGTDKNITTHKNAEEKQHTAHQRLLDIIEFLPDATFVIDNEKKVIAWNRAIEKMTGIHKQDILNKGNYIYAIPFYGKRRPILIDLIGIEDKKTESLYDYIKRSNNTIYCEVFIPSLYGGVGAHLWAIAAPLFDKEGNQYGAIESIRDITERKKTEDLQVSEEKLRAIFESISDGISIVDMKGNILDVNDAHFRLFGYNQKEELIGQNSFDSVIEKDRARAIKSLGKVLKEGYVPPLEFKLKKKDGSEFEAEISASLLRNTAGNPVGLVTLIRDITERKIAEQKLRESEEKYRSILENIKEAYYEVDLKGNFTFFNDALCDILGYSKEELMNMNYREYLSDGTAKIVFNSFNEVYGTEKKVKILDFEIIRKNGIKIFVEFSVSLKYDSHNNKNGFFGMIRDITEKKKAEEELMVKDNAISSSINAIAIVDMQQTITYVNSSFLKMFKYSSEKEVLGKKILDFWQTSRENTAKVFKTLQKTGHWLGEVISKRDDGSSFYSQISTSMVRDSSGKPICMMASFIDITERKKVEHKLKESEEKYRSILENIEEGYYESDLEGNLTFFNDSWCEITGYPKDELMGLNYRQFLTEKSAERVFKFFYEVYKTETIVKIYDFELIKKNGIKRNIELSISLKFDSQNKKCGFYGMARDITEKKKAEALIKKFAEELEEKVKIRTIELDDAITKLNETIKQKDLYVNEVLKSSQFKTEFMATMSHELRTPLNAIIGFSDLLQEGFYGKLNEEQSDFLKDIKSSGEHLLSLVDQILDISKIESGEMKLNLKRFPLFNLINLIKSTINPLIEKKNLHFEVIGLETEKFIEADQIRLKEILYNLLSNAIKFTNDGGIKLKIMENKNEFEFYIINTGIGIAKEDYDLIFKEFQRVSSLSVDSIPGTGLGLPLTKKLINMHGGNISFTSELGKGTTFKFTIPKNLGKVAIKPD